MWTTQARCPHTHRRSKRQHQVDCFEGGSLTPRPSPAGDCQPKRSGQVTSPRQLRHLCADPDSHPHPDFIEAGIDVAIRTREQEPDSNIIVRRIGQMRRVLAAAPSYLAQRGQPETPADLERHDMIVYNLANDPFSLRLRRGPATQTIRISSVLDSNDGQIVVQAALSGLGILIQPLYIVQADILAGRLIPVLMDWQLPLLTMNIAYQNRVRLPAKIRVFSDFLVEHIRKNSERGIWMDT
jgi:DNA-binding transcriptional LysR family regulator